MNIEEWRKGIEKYFPDYVFATEVALSVMAQLLIKDISNPLGVIFVGNSSSGKSTVLDIILGCKEKTYRSDNFTAASFVTQASNVSREKLEEIDLLPKIKGKVLIVRDLTPMFGKRYEKLLEDFSILTIVFDGRGYTRDAGTCGQRGYCGRYLFMFIGATTPFRDEVLEVIGRLGSRIVFYGFDTQYLDSSQIAKELTASLSYKSKVIKCKKLTRKFINGVWSKAKGKVTWDRQKDNPVFIEEIANIANLCAYLRAPIERHEEKIGTEVKFNYKAFTEGPMRLASSLYNLARGHALICERTTLDEEDVKVALRVALDSIPKDRVKIFTRLIKDGGKLTTANVEELLECSKPTALTRMAEFSTLGIAEVRENIIGGAGRREKTLHLLERFAWFKEEKFINLLRHTQAK